MQFIRKALALSVWIVMYVPTTLFVSLVMIRSYLQRRRHPREAVA
jgi:hypothetical protein